MINTTTHPTRAQIAASFSLWQEYVDTAGIVSSDEFDAMSDAEKFAAMDEAFGPETETPTTYFEISIVPASGGFGEYQCQPINDEGWADAYDLLAEIAGTLRGEVLELGVDELPDHVDDIRGRIRNEPARVFAIVHEGGEVAYFGIDSVGGEK